MWRVSSQQANAAGGEGEKNEETVSVPGPVAEVELVIAPGPAARADQTVREAYASQPLRDPYGSR